MPSGSSYDIVIVGGGSAGCVLANRLSANASRSVLLIESGLDDRSARLAPFVLMPKALAKLIGNPSYAFHYPAKPDPSVPTLAPDIRVRGRMLGGSSAVNGMVYHRGQPQDYDRLAELGNIGWGWRDILPYFISIEGHVLPRAEWRGCDGPIALAPTPATPLAEAIITAGTSVGLRRKEDANLPDHRGISHVMANIDRKGRRVSAARAFLPPKVRARPNLRIVTGADAEQILFEGRRAVGVRLSCGGWPVELRAREIIVCAGAMASPLLLQRSGIGRGTLLQSLGVPVVHDNPNVGAHLRDHWNSYQAFDLRHRRDSENRQFAGWRLGLNALRWFAGTGGPLATPTHQLSAFAETEMKADRADVELLFAPYSFGPPAADGSLTTGSAPAMHVFSHALRNTSEGSIAITSADAASTPLIHSNHLTTEYDQRISINGMRLVRSIMTQPALSDFVVGESAPSAEARTDEELLHYSRQYGSCGLHAVGTCRMGPDGDSQAVLDSRLRVRGVEHLRVVDCSIFPEVISGNTNAPVMAAAALAADLIVEDLKR